MDHPGYWQLGLDKNSQEMVSIQTPCVLLSTERVSQGETDSVNNFEGVIHEKFEPVIPNLILWLDDFILHVKSEDGLHTAKTKFLAVCD